MTIPADVTDRDVAEWLEQRAKGLPVGKMLEKDAMKLGARALKDIAIWERSYGRLTPERPRMAVSPQFLIAAPGSPPPGPEHTDPAPILDHEDAKRATDGDNT